MKNKNKKDTNILAIHPRQGGRREGAGRPKGTGKYGEPTMAIRVPESWGIKIQSLLQVKQKDKHLASALVVSDIWQPRFQSETALPLFTHKIAAGFPSPAEDHIEASLDLNEYLIEHPAATFYVRVEGESMVNAGIYPNDILIVDRA
ncbi:MAG TPA: S24 family peptidase, partial [Gammaproteobacteria bacterium]|nr:S24 family peptidase [Gammaproteobacteria bacterium]